MFIKLMLSAAMLMGIGSGAYAAAPVAAAIVRAPLPQLASVAQQWVIQRDAVLHNMHKQPHSALSAMRGNLLMNELVTIAVSPLTDDTYSTFHKLFFLWADDAWLNPAGGPNVAPYDRLNQHPNITSRRLVVLRDLSYNFQNGEMYAGVATASTAYTGQVGQPHFSDGFRMRAALDQGHVGNYIRANTRNNLESPFLEYLIKPLSTQGSSNAKRLAALHFKPKQGSSTKADVIMAIDLTSKGVYSPKTLLATALNELVATAHANLPPNTFALQNIAAPIPQAGFNAMVAIMVAHITAEYQLAFTAHAARLAAAVPAGVPANRYADEAAKQKLVADIAMGDSKVARLANAYHIIENRTFAAPLQGALNVPGNLRPAAVTPVPAGQLVVNLHQNVYASILDHIAALVGGFRPLDHAGAPIGGGNVQVLNNGEADALLEAMKELFDRIERLRGFQNVLLLMRYDANTDRSALSTIDASVQKLETNILADIDNALIAVNIPMFTPLREALLVLRRFVSWRSNVPLKELQDLFSPSTLRLLALNNDHIQHAFSTLCGGVAGPQQITKAQIAQWGATMRGFLASGYFDEVIDAATRDRLNWDIRSITEFGVRTAAQGLLIQQNLGTGQPANQKLADSAVLEGEIRAAHGDIAEAYLRNTIPTAQKLADTQESWLAVLLNEITFAQRAYLLLSHQAWTTINDVADQNQRNLLIQADQDLPAARALMIRHIDTLIELNLAGYLTMNAAYHNAGQDHVVPLAGHPAYNDDLTNLARNGGALANTQGALLPNSPTRSGLNPQAAAKITTNDLLALRQRVATAKVEAFQAVYNPAARFGINIPADLLDQQAILNDMAQLADAQRLQASDMSRYLAISALSDWLCREVSAFASAL